MNRRGLLFWLGLVALVIVVGYVTSSRRNDTGQPLDPDSTDALGTRALVELVERFDGRVTRGLPTDTSAVTVVLVDQLSAEQRDDLVSWVERGGTVVVADPGSPLTPALAFPVVERTDSLTAGSCDVPSLSGLTLEAGTFLLYDRAGASSSCFGDGGGGAFVHIADRELGRIVSIGGGVALSNQYLDEGDNAVLAVELLLPADGAGSVSVVFEPIVTPGSRTLGDLVPSEARWGIVQVLVGLGVAILWKARRFGLPVGEPQPVKLPGSLLVRASGELRRRTGGFEAAGDAVRSHHEQTLRRRLKAPADLPTSELIEVTREAAAGTDRDTVERSLVGPPPTSRAALVELVRAVDTVRLGLDEADAAPLGTHEPAAPDQPTAGADPERQLAGERT